MEPGRAAGQPDRGPRAPRRMRITVRTHPLEHRLHLQPANPRLWARQSLIRTNGQGSKPCACGPSGRAIRSRDTPFRGSASPERPGRTPERGAFRHRDEREATGRVAVMPDPSDGASQRRSCASRSSDRPDHATGALPQWVLLESGRPPADVGLTSLQSSERTFLADAP